MPDLEGISRLLKSIVNVSIRFIKARHPEEEAIALAAMLLWLGYKFSDWLPKDVADFLRPWHGILIGQSILYLVGLAVLAYSGYRIWRLAYVPELPPIKDRPSAIKGPMAFTESDGELFRKLGRESELQKLLGLVLDNQVSMIVIRGASGSGKTSLLRAGLKHILGDRAIFHYWEAVPTEPDKGLLRAIQEKWPEGVAKFSSLDALVNPAGALGQQSHVIVLDQFEQLRGGKKIFQLLSQVIRKSKPPHRITWVIAFRREFSADWMDFISPELEYGFHPPQDISLRLFTPEQAREVIGQLVKESNLSINQDVADNLIEAATIEGDVSPVDIGIGLLVLAELYERQGGKTITIHDYQFAGGAEGLLTQYMSRCLELFPKENHETILKAVLALCDPETNQRVAEGLTIDELATESGAEGRLLKSQLDRLSYRDTRLLETVLLEDGSAMRYRLLHERLIPALYRLTGKLLAEVDQAKLKFQNAFQAWKTNDKRSNYLLKIKDLRLIERYESKIPWGNDEHEKKYFLSVSQRRYKFIKIAVVATVVALIGIGWESNLQYQRYEAKRYLRESGYPEELYNWQHQMKKLELTEPLNLEHFTWLSSDSIEELSLNVATSSSSVAGLASLSRCKSLKALKLNLKSAFGAPNQVRSLEPLSNLSNLTQLSLDAGDSEITNFGPVLELSKLTQLTLNFHGFATLPLDPLTKLSNLKELTLDYNDREFGFDKTVNLEPLSKLSNLKELILIIGNSKFDSLEPLSKLSNLTQLTIRLDNYGSDKLDMQSKLNNLEVLSKLSNLTHLAISLGGVQLSSLEPLSKLSNLTHLTLSMDESKVESLDPLTKLSNLTELTLDFTDNKENYLETLAKLSNLTHLSIALHKSPSITLEPLAKLSNLTQLVLRCQLDQTVKLEPLTKLSNLKQLTLDISGSKVDSLDPLTKLSNLTELTLGLGESQVKYLDLLPKLNTLKQLTLFLPLKVNNIEPLAKLNNQTKLSLDFSFRLASAPEALAKLNLPRWQTATVNLDPSHERDFEPFSKLNNLTKLRIALENQLSSLEPLSKLDRLQTLSIERVTTVQRRSLRNIPPNLVELTF